MLETIREYAREYLIKRDDAAATAVRHCDHFLVLAKAANQGLQGPEQAEWTRRVEAELDNLRAAIALALEGGVDPVLAVKFEVALMGFWMLRGYSTEGRKYVRAALALPAVQASDVAHAHALYVGAALADSQSDHAEARRMLEDLPRAAPGLGNPIDIAATLSTLSLVRLHAGDADESARRRRGGGGDLPRRGERIGEAIGLLHLGEICAVRRRRRAAQPASSSASRSPERSSTGRSRPNASGMLGELALEAGHCPARALGFARSLEVCREAEDKRGEATALWWMGKADLAAARPTPRASSLARRCARSGRSR